MIYFDFVKKDLTVLLCRENNNFFVRTGIYIVSKKNERDIYMYNYIYIYMSFSLYKLVHFSLSKIIYKKYTINY